MIREYKGNRPEIDPRAWVADNADVIGDVVVAEDASVWFLPLHGPAHTGSSKKSGSWGSRAAISLRAIGSLTRPAERGGRRGWHASGACGGARAGARAAQGRAQRTAARFSAP